MELEPKGDAALSWDVWYEISGDPKRGWDLYECRGPFGKDPAETTPMGHYGQRAEAEYWRLKLSIAREEERNLRGVHIVGNL